MKRISGEIYELNENKLNMVFGYNIDKENKGDYILYVELDHAIE